MFFFFYRSQFLFINEMNNSGNYEEQDPDYAAPGPSTSYQQKVYEETGEIILTRVV